MYPFPNLTEPLQTFLETGLVISPWLPTEGASDRFDASMFAFLNERVADFVATHWTERELLRTFGDMPVADRLPRTAVYEIAASTAAYLAIEESEDFTVCEETISQALSMVGEFVVNHRFGTLLQVYALVTSYENQHALDYYDAIPEREFILGLWHRPWVDYTLGDELLSGIYMGNYRLVVRGMKRYVELTDEGRAALAQTTKMLEDSGYMKHRLRMLHVSQFNLFKDYAKLARELSPEFSLARHQFLDFAGVKPGDRVLELGCGAGVFTFEGGLANRVGPAGHIVGIDPSVRMVTRGEIDRKQRGIDWVEFQEGQAEQIPYPDSAFDHVTGAVFLHFTELKQAVAEMVRVAKPEGTVSSIHLLKVNLDLPFFREWFAPILDIAARRNQLPQDFLLQPDQVPNAFAAAGCTDFETQHVNIPARMHDVNKVIQHFIHGVGWFQEELASLPWRARHDVIAELYVRGREVVRKYPARERFIYFPMEMIRVTVHKK